MPNLHSPESITATTHHSTTRYRDRQTRNLVVERVPGQSLLHWLYGTKSGMLFFRTFLNHPLCSRLYGWWQQSAWTRRQIRPFVERYRIDLDQIEHSLDHYQSFNDFFIRRLKSQARPFDPEPTRLCCPADGKVLVYPRLAIDAELTVKGAALRPSALLSGAIDPAPYAGGAALVVRLAPYDYHRFHFPLAGQAGKTHSVAGGYHSVNPIALKRVPDVFHHNRRAVCELEAPHFGKVAYVEVGALNVASIVQTYVPGTVERGQEKGYFQFGGSTVVLLFQAGAIVFDEDLATDSATGLEVHVRAGEACGYCA